MVDYASLIHPTRLRRSMPVCARLSLVAALHVLAAMKSISGDCGWRSMTDKGRAFARKNAFLIKNSPSGKSASSPKSKNKLLPHLVETALWIPIVPPHSEGRLAIVGDARRDAVDAAAFCVRRACRAGRKICER